jgi:hypothetical protein
MTASILNAPRPVGECTQFAEPRRVPLGTDFPMAQGIAMKTSIEGVERLAGRDDVQAIEGENAQTLFRRLAALR